MISTVSNCYWDKNKKIYKLKYIPDNPQEYTRFSIDNYYGTKFKLYQIKGDKVYLYGSNQVKHLAVMEKKYLNKLKKFSKIRLNIVMNEVKDINSKTVKDVLDECGIDRFSIGYCETRTINRAYFREAIAYAKSYCGCLIFFRKRGGLLCYNISKVIHNYDFSENKGHHLSLQKGLNLLREIKNKNTGIVYLPKEVEEEIINECILENI